MKGHMHENEQTGQCHRHACCAGFRYHRDAVILQKVNDLDACNKPQNEKLGAAQRLLRSSVLFHVQAYA